VSRADRAAPGKRAGQDQPYPLSNGFLTTFFAGRTLRGLVGSPLPGQADLAARGRRGDDSLHRGSQSAAETGRESPEKVSLRERGVEHKPELEVEFGEAAQRIRKVASEWQVGLIVLARILRRSVNAN
jgi:hypothetical protein